jgi:hypothetical protein
VTVKAIMKDLYLVTVMVTNLAIKTDLEKVMGKQKVKYLGTMKDLYSGIYSDSKKATVMGSGLRSG